MIFVWCLFQWRHYHPGVCRSSLFCYISLIQGKITQNTQTYLHGHITGSTRSVLCGLLWHWEIQCGKFGCGINQPKHWVRRKDFYVKNKTLDHFCIVLTIQTVVHKTDHCETYAPMAPSLLLASIALGLQYKPHYTMYFHVFMWLSPWTQSIGQRVYRSQRERHYAKKQHGQPSLYFLYLSWYQKHTEENGSSFRGPVLVASCVVQPRWAVTFIKRCVWTLEELQKFLTCLLHLSDVKV